jgi:hypothetical protein
MTESPDSSEIDRKLAELRAAHRALDEQITQLIEQGFRDQLQVQRLKKQKLALIAASRVRLQRRRVRAACSGDRRTGSPNSPTASPFQWSGCRSTGVSRVTWPSLRTGRTSLLP